MLRIALRKVLLCLFVFCFDVRCRYSGVDRSTSASRMSSFGNEDAPCEIFIIYRSRSHDDSNFIFSWILMIYSPGEQFLLRLSRFFGSLKILDSYLEAQNALPSSINSYRLLRWIPRIAWRSTMTSTFNAPITDFGCNCIRKCSGHVCSDIRLCLL